MVELNNEQKKAVQRLLNTVTENTLELNKVFESVYLYDERLIKIIDKNGLILDANSQLDLIKYHDCPIKIEGYEKFSNDILYVCRSLARYLAHSGPITCHVFKSPKDSVSFPMHVDPDNVVLYLLKGIKNFIVNNESVLLKEGDWFFIPSNVPHKAINVEDSIMLSIGLEKFIVEKL